MIRTRNSITPDTPGLTVPTFTVTTLPLTVTSSAYNNFRLYGANISDGENSASPANPYLKKALWIKNGTLVLQGLVAIPSLSEGSTGGGYPSDFFIPGNGALVLDGVGVMVLSTADDFREVNGLHRSRFSENAKNYHKKKSPKIR